MYTISITNGKQIADFFFGRGINQNTLETMTHAFTKKKGAGFIEEEPRSRISQYRGRRCTRYDLTVLCKR